MNKQTGLIELILIGAVFIVACFAADLVHDVKHDEEQQQESTKK